MSRVRWPARPTTLRGLDFFAGMDAATQADGQAMVADGEDSLLEDYQASLEWLDTLEAEPGDLSPAVHRMLVVAFRDGLAPRPGGSVDDCRALVRPWGFDIGDIAVPTRVMLARGDSSVPAAHGEWLVQRLRRGELVWVDGGHFGSRAEPEEQLLAWVGGHPSHGG